MVVQELVIEHLHLHNEKQNENELVVKNVMELSYKHIDKITK